MLIINTFLIYNITLHVTRLSVSNLYITLVNLISLFGLILDNVLIDNKYVFAIG